MVVRGKCSSVIKKAALQQLIQNETDRIKPYALNRPGSKHKPCYYIKKLLENKKSQIGEIPREKFNSPESQFSILDLVRTYKVRRGLMRKIKIANRFVNEDECKRLEAEGRAIKRKTNSQEKFVVLVEKISDKKCASTNNSVILKEKIIRSTNNSPHYAICRRNSSVLVNKLAKTTLHIRPVKRFEGMYKNLMYKLRKESEIKYKLPEINLDLIK